MPHVLRMKATLLSISNVPSSSPACPALPLELPWHTGIRVLAGHCHNAPSHRTRRDVRHGASSPFPTALAQALTVAITTRMTTRTFSTLLSYTRQMRFLFSRLDGIKVVQAIRAPLQKTNIPCASQADAHFSTFKTYHQK